jgi:hypothetical protein
VSSDTTNDTEVVVDAALSFRGGQARATRHGRVQLHGFYGWGLGLRDRANIRAAAHTVVKVMAAGHTENGVQGSEIGLGVVVHTTTQGWHQGILEPIGQINIAKPGAMGDVPETRVKGRDRFRSELGHGLEFLRSFALLRSHR